MQGVRTQPAVLKKGNTWINNNPQQVPENLSNKDILIRYLCQRGEDSIHDMHVVNTDASYYFQRTSEKYL